MDSPQKKLLKNLREIEHVQVLSRKDEVLEFASVVQEHADSDRNALGFLPGGVYLEAAQNENLFVAIVEENGTRNYAGHLYFGGTYPNARIVQLYVKKKFRRHGIARRLVSELTARLEDLGWSTIKAQVADDLRDANAAWERLGFETLRQRAGGESRKRVINVRIKFLESLTLFPHPEEALSKDLPLSTPPFISTPVYVIDLNVFFDVVRRRPRSEFSSQVIAAGFKNLVKVVIAEEFVNELRRTSCSASDPALEFALELPKLPSPPPQRLAELIDELAIYIFPGKALSTQDRSDLAHVATAIHHNAAGFVTSETALVNAHDKIFSTYGLRILHVSNFSNAVRTSEVEFRQIQNQVSGWTLRVASPDRHAVASLIGLIEKVGVPTTFKEEFCQPDAVTGKKTIVLQSENDILCAISWDSRSGLHSAIRARLLANEDHPSYETGVDAAVFILSQKVAREGPSLVRLEVPVADVVSKQICESRGFRLLSIAAGVATFEKITVGRVLHPANWTSFCTWLKGLAKIEFSPNLPNFLGEFTPIRFVAPGGEKAINLTTLETLLAPVIVVVPERTGAIAPIRAEYSSVLLDASPQLKMTPFEGPLFLPEKIYFSSAKNSKTLRKGLPLIFYESGAGVGRSSAIAVARIIETVVAPKSSVSATLLRHGVLGLAEIATLGTQDKIALTTFDNLMLFKTPVPFRRLQELGCVGEQNLITSCSLKYEQLLSVLDEGEPECLNWTF